MSPIYIPDVDQGTDAWHALRLGHWTASCAAKIMGGLDTQGLKDLIKDVAWGRAIGPTDRGYSNRSMERGHELEPEAREQFAFERDVEIEQLAFVRHASIPWLGWSPDGLHSQRRRGLEIKCLEHKAWIDVFTRREIPAEYRWQAKFACFVGQLEALDFYVYHPLAGGIALVATLTDEDAERITDRLALLEPKVQALVDQLQSRAAA